MIEEYHNKNDDLDTMEEDSKEKESESQYETTEMLQLKA